MPKEKSSIVEVSETRSELRSNLTDFSLGLFGLGNSLTKVAIGATDASLVAGLLVIDKMSISVLMVAWFIQGSTLHPLMQILGLALSVPTSTVLTLIAVSRLEVTEGGKTQLFI